MTYLEMPASLLDELGANVALTKEMRYAHGVCLKGNTGTDFYCTMYEGKRYKTTKKQIELAKVLYEKNKQSVLNSIGNKLVFVGMGMNYAPRYEDDVCNHRIRTNIVNPENKNFFVELGTWGAEMMRYDHLVDRDLEETYMTMLNKLRLQIGMMGGFNKVPNTDPIMIEYRNYQNQPYNWYREEYARGLINKGIKYTNKNVLQFVNDIFGCNFNDMEVDYYHLTTEDYKSISPNF